MHIYFGSFDIAAVAALLAINVWCFRRRVRLRPLLFFLIALPLFGFVLPIVSMSVETARYMNEEASSIVDAFETAYTLLRFPEYWAAGLLQALVFVYGWRLQRRGLRATTNQ